MTDSLGKYRILAEIGKGGFATVYRALDTTLDREVALKVLDPILARDPAWVSRFQREAKAIARLKHPHIITIHEIGESEGRLYIAMALIEGPSLAQRIAERGRLTWDETLTILEQIAGALDYAHNQGVLHRDLKPANILLDPRTGAVLTDFGFARLVGESSMSVSLSGGVVGTPAYIAPEVWDGEEPTAQTDLYSLGCVAYEMLTGEVLFAGKTPSVVMRQHLIDGPRWPDAAHWPAGVPEVVRDVLTRALAKESAARYANGGVMVAAFSVSSQPASARSSDVTSPNSPKRSEMPVLAPARVPTPQAARSRPRWLWPAVGVGGLALLVVLMLVLKAAIGGDQATPTPVAAAPTAAAVAAMTTAAPSASTRAQSLTPSPTASTTSTPAPTDTVTPSPAASATPSPSPTSTPSPTVTATASPVQAFTVGSTGVDVRSGPGLAYPILGAIQAGQTYEITARNAESNWWEFDYTGKLAWVSDQVVIANAAAGNAEVRPLPPTPVPVATPTGGGTGKIAFFSFRSGNDEIYLTNADGGNLQRLTDSPSFDKVPYWSRDGMYIAFASEREGGWDIWATDTNGANLTRLTNDGTEKYPHGWSPDGHSFAYDARRGEKFSAFIMSLEDSNVREISLGEGWTNCPTWSPDGTKLLLTYLYQQKRDLYVVDLDDGHSIRLTDGGEVSGFCGSWSPDGSKIAFPWQGDIYTMKPDGADWQALTRQVGNNWDPSWSPDGRILTFTSNRDGNNEIYIVNADGSGQRRLTDYPSNDEWAVWQP